MRCHRKACTAIVVAVRAPSSRRLLEIAVAGACLFPSSAATVDANSRDRHLPLSVGWGCDDHRREFLSLFPAAGDASAQDPELKLLLELRERSESTGQSLQRIHYGYLPSPYPPMSQAIFAFDSALTSDAASLHGHEDQAPASVTQHTVSCLPIS